MATASLPSSCEEQQNNNLDEYSDYSDAESEKVRKAEKAKKPDNEKWSSSLICNLIDEYEARPCLWNIFCDDYHNRDVTRLWRPSNSSRMSSCITATKIMAIAALLG